MERFLNNYPHNISFRDLYVWKRQNVCDYSKYVIAEEKGRNYREFMSLSKELILVLYREKGNSNECHFHECIPNDMPVSLYLEFDFDKKKSRGCVWGRYVSWLNVAVKEIQKILGLHAKRKLKWVTLCGTDDNKFSQHIVSRSICFKSKKDCHQFIVNAFKEFCDRWLNESTYKKKEFMGKIVDMISRSDIGFPDYNIYGKSHTLRMAYSSKMGGVRPLIPVVNDMKIVGFDSDMISESLIAHPPTSLIYEHHQTGNGGKPERDWINKVKSMKLIKMNDDVIYYWEQRNKSTRVILPINSAQWNGGNLYKRWDQKLNLTNSRANEILGEIMPKYTRIMKPGVEKWDFKVRKTTKEVTFSLVKFHLIGKYCFKRGDWDNGKSTHNNEGRELVINMRTGLGTVICGFNKNCKRVKDKTFVLSNDDLLKFLDFINNVENNNNNKKRGRENPNDREDDDKKKKRKFD